MKTHRPICAKILTVEMRSKAIRSAFGGLAPHLNPHLRVCYDEVMGRSGNISKNDTLENILLEIS